MSIDIMTTPTGQIGLSDVNDELGLSTTAQITINDADVRTLAGVTSGQISMNDLRGKTWVTASWLPLAEDDSMWNIRSTSYDGTATYPYQTTFRPVSSSSTTRTVNTEFFTHSASGNVGVNSVGSITLGSTSRYCTDQADYLANSASFSALQTLTTSNFSGSGVSTHNLYHNITTRTAVEGIKFTNTPFVLGNPCGLDITVYRGGTLIKTWNYRYTGGSTDYTFIDETSTPAIYEIRCHAWRPMSGGFYGAVNAYSGVELKM